MPRYKVRVERTFETTIAVDAEDETAAQVAAEEAAAAMDLQDAAWFAHPAEAFGVEEIDEHRRT